VPSYHSLDAADGDDETDAAELPNVAEDVGIQQPGAAMQSAAAPNFVIAILFQFITFQSYIGMLIIMMVRFYTWCFLTSVINVKRILWFIK